MVHVRCQHCDHKWNYRGKSKYYATCPRCQYKVKIPEDKTRTMGRKKSSLESKRRSLIGKRPVRLLGIAGIVNKTIEDYQYDKDMLIQILLRLQRDFGWLPREMLSEVSKQLEVPLGEVYQVATFYKALSLAPRGKHLIRVCMGTSCKVRGASTILDRVQSLLGIEPGETTSDLKYSLETVSCIGCCATGPMIVIDDKYFGHMKASRVETVLKPYR